MVDGEQGRDCEERPGFLLSWSALPVRAGAMLPLTNGIHSAISQPVSSEEEAMPDNRLIRPFGGFLQDQRGGKLAAELAEQLNTLVEAVLQHKKSGKLKLTIKVSPTKMLGVLSVADEVSVSLPAPDKGEAMFFADKDFNLVRNNPDQLEMDNVHELPPVDVRNLRTVGEGEGGQ